MTFQRPYQRSSAPSNTPANCAANVPANVYQRYCQRLFSNPPYPPALETPNAAGSRLGVPAAQGREGQEGPRSTHVCGNAQTAALWSCITQPLSRQANPLVTVTIRPERRHALPRCFPQSRLTLRSNRKRLIRLDCLSCEPLCPNHVALIGEGVSRAGANPVFHSVEAVQARARRLIAGETAELAEKPELPGKKKGGGAGVGGKRDPHGYFEVPRLFRVGSKKPVARRSRQILAALDGTTAAVPR